MRIISTAYQVEITTCDGQVHFVFIPSYPSCSGALAPGLAADMHFKSDVIAFVGPACLFALEPVAGLAAYWNTPIITGMGDQPPSEGELSVTSGILGRLQKWNKSDSAVSVPLNKLSNWTLGPNEAINGMNYENGLIALFRDGEKSRRFRGSSRTRPSIPR
jgi:hypothetical protein